MANFIVSPYAISFNSIKNALESYINDKSTSEVLDTWSDFYTAGAGQTVLELDAAIGAFYAFHFILGRREAYLPLAQNYQSILGGAESLGFNASRGRNVHIGVTINANTSRVLSKWDVIGSYAEYDLILWEDTIINQDQDVTLHCVIGNSNAQSIAIDTKDIKQFVFTAEDTTDDVRLILTDKEVPFATELKDAMNDKYIMLSNPYGSVDVFYLNKGQYTYSTKDTLYLQYIERNSIKFSQITKDSLTVDYGEVSSFEMISNREDKQSKQSIKTAAPIYHETNNVVRARRDYCKYLLTQGGLNLLDTNDFDINPGLMALTYLKEKDETGNNLLTDDQKEQFIEALMKVCPDGVAKAFIEDPIPVIRTLSITLWKDTDQVIPADVNDYIEEILDNYRNVLAPTLDLEAIEKALEANIPGVKIARVDIGATDYALNTKYKLYDVINVKKVNIGGELQDWKMINSKVQTTSGSYAPDWGSASSFGDKVYDNNLIWEKSNKYLNAIAGRWKANGEFNLYNDVAVGYDIYPNCTSYTYPEWGPMVVTDGNVTFTTVKTYDYNLDYWMEDTPYTEGEYVLFNANDLTGKRYAVYKVKETLNKSGSVEPMWSDCTEIDGTISDNALTWTLKFKGFKAANEYLVGDKIAYIKNNKIYVYSCVNTCNADTVYSNTKKKASEQLPFDESQEIKEWIEVDTNETITEQTGVDSDNNPIYTTTVITEWQEGQTIWYLDNIYENIITWAPNTELALLKYVQGGDDIFYSTSNSNSRTGEDWFSTLEEWPETYTDNNIVWELDTITVGENKYNATGTTWFAGTEYAVDDIAFVDGNNNTYAYMVTYTNPNVVVANNIVYTVSGYCGVTSPTEDSLQWSYEDDEGNTVYYNNVVDNNILWTKTENKSDLEWAPNTTMSVGNIIKIDDGDAYYMFSTVMGTSGSITPDWTGIKNNVVVDNDIVWEKLGETTRINLGWNEYLELDYTLTLN